MEAMYSVTKGRIPIEVRVVGDERLAGGTDIRERIEFLKEASRYVDMLCVSTGTLFYGNAMCYNMPSYYVPNGCTAQFGETAVENGSGVAEQLNGTLSAAAAKAGVDVSELCSWTEVDGEPVLVAK